MNEIKLIVKAYISKYRMIHSLKNLGTSLCKYMVIFSFADKSLCVVEGCTLLYQSNNR